MIDVDEQGPVLEPRGTGTLGDLGAYDVGPLLDQLSLTKSLLKPEVAQNGREDVSNSSEGTSRHTQLSYSVWAPECTVFLSDAAPQRAGSAGVTNGNNIVNNVVSRETDGPGRKRVTTR